MTSALKEAQTKARKEALNSTRVDPATIKRIIHSVQTKTYPQRPDHSLQKAVQQHLIVLLQNLVEKEKANIRSTLKESSTLSKNLRFPPRISLSKNLKEQKKSSNSDMKGQKGLVLATKKHNSLEQTLEETLEETLGAGDR